MVWRYAISLVRHFSLKAHSLKTKIHTNMQIFSTFSIFHVDYDRFKVILDQSSGSEYMAFNCTDVFCEHALLTSCFSYPTVGKNPDVSTGPLARLFACLLAPLTRLLAHSLPFTHSLRCTHLCARSLT